MDGMWYRIEGTLKVFCTAVLLLGVSSCGTTHGPIPADALSKIDEYEYVIGAGDKLDIFVWGYPDLTITLPVRPDGKITTRLVEDMPASGKTPTELARDIETRYARYVKNPVVSVSVSGFVGARSQQIKVVGGGSKPQTVPYSNDITLLELMITVGGLGEYANGNKSVPVRKLDGKNVSYTIRIHDLMKKGDISADVMLFPGDIIIIPESFF